MTLAETLSARQQRRQQLGPTAPDAHWGEYFALPGRWTLIAILVLSPWLFGANYSWGQFWVSTALFIGLVMWWLESAFSLRRAQVIPYVFWFVAIGLLLGLAQIVVWPSFITSTFGGLQTQWYEAYSVGGDSRTAPRLSIDTESTWHYLRLLILGAAALLLGARFFRRRKDVVVLLTAMTLNGVALSLFAIFQKLTFNGKIYWFYESIYRSTPYGPFVNRNNAAGYLLLCLAAAAGLLYLVWDRRKENGPDLIVSKEIPIWRQLQTHLMIAFSELTAAKLAVTLACVVISAGVVGSLSRGGVLGLLAGAIVGMLYFGMARKPKLGSLMLVPMVAAVLLLTSWIGLYDRLVARFENVDRSDRQDLDGRVESWRTTIPMVWRSGWTGAGLGTYPRVHRMLSDSPERNTYMHAENQFVQTIVELGIPGLLVLLAALALGFHCSLFLLYRGSSDFTVGLGLAGVVLLSSQCVAGCFDFGWYVPSNTILFAALAGAVGYHCHSLAGRLKNWSWLQYEAPGWCVKAVALISVIGVLIVTLDFYQRKQVDAQIRSMPRRLLPSNLSEAETERRIEQLIATSKRGATTESLNQLAELWIHRARLAYWDALKAELGTSRLSEIQRDEVEDNLWQLTSVLRMQEQVGYLRFVRGVSFAAEFRRTPWVQRYLPLAREALLSSLRLVPLQPEAQVRWMQLEAIMGDVGDEALDRLDQAVQLAPTNMNLRYIAALSHCFVDRIERAFPHLRVMLQLDEGQFTRTVKFMRGLSGRIPHPIDNQIVIEQILPTNPRLMLDYATRYLDDEPELKRMLLDKAYDMLAVKTLSDLDAIRLRADVSVAGGHIDRAIQDLRSIVTADANDQRSHIKLIRLLLDANLPNEALQHAERLARINSRNREVARLLEEAQKAAGDSKSPNPQQNR